MQKTIDAKARKKAITAAGIGNFVEWFDFVLYAQFAAIIAVHFFPSDNPTTGLLATFAVFALGFLARPIGGVIFGHARSFPLAAMPCSRYRPLPPS